MYSKRLLYIVLILLFLLFGLHLNFIYAVRGLDFSWVYAINQIHLNQNYIFGKDVFFTYGPLGYLLFPVFMKPIIYEVLCFKFFIMLSFIYLLTGFRSYKRFDVFCFILTLIFIYFGFPNLEFLAALAGCAYLKTKGRQKYLILVLFNILAFLMLFIKFNIGVLFISTLIFTLIADKFDKKSLLISLIFWIFSLGASVCFYFGDINTLYDWLRVSLMIANGYSEAMLIWRDLFNQIYLLFAVIIIALYINLWCNEIKFKNINLKIFLVILPSIFFAFKSGFVRADGHMLVFFDYILCISLLLYLLIESINLKKIIVMFLLALIFPLMYVNKSNTLSFIYELFYNESQLYVDDSSILPNKWLKIIGNKKVEILPYDFSYAPKYNINLHYNPIFQLYSVYTKDLDLISANNYKAQKTDYIIVDNSFSIDKRNLILDNPATWEAMRTNYEVRDFYSGKILLQKRSNKKEIDYRTYKSEIYSINEDILVPKDAKKAVIHLDLSLTGKLFNFLFKIVPFYIYVRYNNDNVLRIRQIRDVMNNGLYIDEIVLSMNDLNNWLKFKPIGKNIDSIKLYSALKFIYKKDFKIEWQR